MEIQRIDAPMGACTTFLAEGSWRRGRRQHPYNAFCLQLDGSRWYRFRVHCVGVYWKEVETPVHPVLEGWEFRLTPVTVCDIVGREIEQVDYGEDRTGQTVTVEEITYSFCREAILRLHLDTASRFEIRWRGDDLELRLLEVATIAGNDRRANLPNTVPPFAV